MLFFGVVPYLCICDASFCAFSMAHTVALDVHKCGTCMPCPWAGMGATSASGGGVLCRRAGACTNKNAVLADLLMIALFVSFFLLLPSSFLVPFQRIAACCHALCLPAIQKQNHLPLHTNLAGPGRSFREQEASPRVCR